MTPAELKILSIPRVQERIVEAMGGLQTSDEFLDTHGKWFLFRHKTVLEDGAVEYYCTDNKGRNVCFDYLDDAIRIPLAMPMPGVDDKRTLIGMIKDFYRLSTYGDKWAVTCMGNPPPTFTAPTPYFALLKALAAQWGVEVKE